MIVKQPCDGRICEATAIVRAAQYLENKDTVLLPARPGLRMRSRSITRLLLLVDDTGRVGQIEAAGKVPTANGSGGCSAAKERRALSIHSRFASTKLRTSFGRVRRGTTTSTLPRGNTLMERRFALALTRTEKPDTWSGSSFAAGNSGNCWLVLCTGRV